ncbi:MAG: hypothetical protein Q9180_008298, partial [Flavoplaca navasiana]
APSPRPKQNPSSYQEPRIGCPAHRKNKPTAQHQSREMDGGQSTARLPLRGLKTPGGQVATTERLTNRYARL